MKTADDGYAQPGIGLISVGWMGKLHSRAYQAIPLAYPELKIRPRFVHAADTAPDRADYAREVLGYAKAGTDYRDVLADPDVDVVSICAPNMLHREIGVAAARAGKPFWIEKPVGRDVSETAEVAAAAQAAGVVTSIGYNYRHVPAVERVRELIAAGELGRITNVRAAFFNSYAAEPNGALSWRFRRDQAGSGALGDLLSHVVDLLQYVVAPITEVSSLLSTVHTQRPVLPMGSATHFAVIENGEMGEVENDDYVAALVRFAAWLSRGRGGRHPGGVPGQRRPAVRAQLRDLRHRRLRGLELRADERVPALPGPGRGQRWVHHRPGQCPSRRLRPVPAGTGQQHELRRPQGHRGQEVPGRGGRRRPAQLHHRGSTGRRRRHLGHGGLGPGRRMAQGDTGSRRHVRARLMAGRLPVVVALGSVDSALVAGVLDGHCRFVSDPGDAELSLAAGAIVRADARVDQALLDKAPALRVVARTGVGVELVDVAAATARGIAVVITPGAGAAAVAEGAIGMALHLVKRFGTLTALVREGRWAQRTEVPVGDLGGAALGVVGYGRIGQRAAELGAAFGMRILAYDPVSEPPADVRCTDLGDLAERSDVITLHLPLTGQTRHLVDDSFLARVKPGAVLVNCSRGGLIDTDAVWRALAAGRLTGVGLDVFDPEPPRPHPLYSHPGVVLTPHLMGLSRRATAATFTAAARGILDVLAGREPQAVANPAWRTHRQPEDITHDQLR